MGRDPHPGGGYGGLCGGVGDTRAVRADPHAAPQALAHIEAYIDFSEDDNVEEEVLSQGKVRRWGGDALTPLFPHPHLSVPAVDAAVRALERQIAAHLQDGRRGEMLRSGVRAVIAGPPNVGKSSLLNLLCEWGAGGSERPPPTRGRATSPSPML